ncbi:MAG TPA: HEAT repeat domain-containing protein [Planctomycetota bacterium]|nr:HEAT repeat domain-containing protein [Planctomycetota bacterium]
MSYFVRSIRIVSVIALAAICAGATAGEVLDNKKVLNMVRKGVALEVILKLMEPSADPTQRNTGSTFRFDSSPEAIIDIQDAAKEGNWSKEDTATLQKKITELAKKDEKMLKELVDRALNVFENADDKEYDSMMRTLAGEGKRVVPFLLAKMEQESDRKRGGVVDAVGRMGDKSDNVIRAITLMLTDRSKPVRAQAAKAIVALSDEVTLKELLAKLSSRTEKLDGVATALGYLGNATAIEPLTKLLKTSGDSDTRVCAAFALGELRARQKESAEALLAAVLDEHDEKLRETAALALTSKLGDKRAPSYIMKAYQRYRNGRAELIKTLSYIKDLSVLEFLAEQVDNDDPKVKRAAHETLVLLTGEEAKDSEEWRGIITVIRGRPDWIQTDTPRVPDARRERDGALRTGDGNETIPTSLR